MSWITDKDGCGSCDHCGMDMDMDPFCVHPSVTKEHPHGLYIRSARPKYCDGRLWTERKPRTLPVVQP